MSDRRTDAGGDTGDGNPSDVPGTEQTDGGDDERTRPYSTVRFLVEVDGFPEAGFSACRLGGSSSEVLTYREGNEPLGSRTLPGTTSYEPIALERGVGDAAALAEWRGMVESGRVADARRDIVVALLDEAGDPGPRWVVRAAWPARYLVSTFDASDGDVAVELLELAHDGFERR